MDEALWLPTEKSVRVALRTQQIIAHESGAADTIDPLAGSYLVEYLTDEIESHAYDYLQKIDAKGGALAAIENGYIQREIQDSAYRHQLALENGDEIVVGLNAYQSDEEVDLDRLQVNPEIEQNQHQRLSQLREGRDNIKVKELLQKVGETSRGSGNLVPLFIKCVENDITLGEICTVLRETWGLYQPPSWG
jgi:methylmalonyl-CoA mutase N-terminal domain/subunit